MRVEVPSGRSLAPLRVEFCGGCKASTYIVGLRGDRIVTSIRVERYTEPRTLALPPFRNVAANKVLPIGEYDWPATYLVAPPALPGRWVAMMPPLSGPPGTRRVVSKTMIVTPSNAEGIYSKRHIK